MASTTNQTLWQMLARELGPHVAVTATSDVASPHPDIARWFISFNLIEPTATREGHFAWTTTSTGVSQSLRVLREMPAIGALAMDYLSGSGSWLTGSTIEVLWPLPIFNTRSITGLVTFLQQAGREVWYRDLVTLSTTANASEVDLSAQAAWLDSEDLVMKDDQGRPLLYGPSIQTGYRRPLHSWNYDGLTFEAGVPTLNLKKAYGATTVQLDMLRPVFSLVSTAESSTGPTTSTQTVGGNPSEIVAVAKLKCLEYLSTAEHISAEERQRYAGEVEPQRAIVKSTVKHWLPQPQVPTSTGKAA